MEPSLHNLLSAIFWLTAAGAAVRIYPFFHREKRFNILFFALFLIKLLAGAGVWWIYTYYYTDRTTSDIYRFFADARVAYDLLGTRPDLYLKIVTGVDGNASELLPIYDTMNNWYKSFDDGFINENRTLIRLNALLMPLTLGSYFGNLVIICFGGTLAQAYLFRSVTAAVPVNATFTFALLNLWPSELFWTSALMKEPILMAGLALSLGAALNAKRERSLIQAGLLLAGIWITLFAKFYVGIALLFPLLAILLTPVNASLKKSLLISGGMIIALLGLIMLWGILVPHMDIPMLIAAKKKAFANVAESTGAGSAFHIPELQPDLPSLMALVPAGLANALLRPFPQDAGSMMEWAAVAENFLFLGLIAYLLFRAKSRFTWKALPINLILFGFIVLALGGITVNISGALVRYKMPVIPYLAWAFYLFTTTPEKAST